MSACIDAIEEAKEEGRTTNYGCVGHFPLDQPIPWIGWSGGAQDMLYVTGKCVCDNMLVNFFADAIIDALPIIAQVRSNTIQIMLPSPKHQPISSHAAGF